MTTFMSAIYNNISPKLHHTENIKNNIYTAASFRSMLSADSIICNFGILCIMKAHFICKYLQSGPVRFMYGISNGLIM